jgi:hypothetical protein
MFVESSFRFETPAYDTGFRRNSAAVVEAADGGYPDRLGFETLRMIHFSKHLSKQVS